MTVESTFANLLLISKQMAETVAQQDWEALNRLQSERVALIGAMRHGAATINESEAHRVRHLIEAIQACDEQVSAYIEPTHQQIKALIDSISRRS